MMRCDRPAEPPVLAAGRAAWTTAYCARRAANPGAAFYWPDARDPASAPARPLNQHILPALLAMTDGHCAYCDAYPFDSTGSPTIDHFHPKSRAPALAYAWDNLFPCCHKCQERSGVPNDWSPDLLKPDLSGYDFDRYFCFDPASGGIEANPAASPEDQHRAEETIRIFGLNIGSRPAQRRSYVRRYRDADDEIRAYRFAFEATPAPPPAPGSSAT